MILDLGMSLFKQIAKAHKREHRQAPTSPYKPLPYKA